MILMARDEFATKFCVKSSGTDSQYQDSTGTFHIIHVLLYGTHTLYTVHISDYSVLQILVAIVYASV